MAMKVLSSGLEIRKPGYKIKTGVSIVGGQPVRFDPADNTGATICLASGGSTVGFATGSNVSPLSNNYFYDDYDRSGLMSYVCGNGNEIEVWNDGRGEVFVTTDTFTVGANVYATVGGKISVTALGGIIGIVTKAPSSATDSLRIQISL
jgi:hypothetical protein